MRSWNFLPISKDQGEVVATFGQAQLVRFADGRLELRGGSKEDHGEAREWISLFWHEAVIAVRVADHRR